MDFLRSRQRCGQKNGVYRPGNFKTAMFITIEGIEGSGKSTQIGNIAGYLREAGLECLITREPGGTGIGEKIRTILLNRDHHMLDPMAELLLYTADRAQHIREKILPALQSGMAVVCDRFIDSTIAYQGAARGIGPQTIHELSRLVLPDLRPDVTFLLDLSPEVGLLRAWKEIESGNRDGGQSRFEREKIRFHETVREGYLALAAAEPERFRIIDAADPPERVRDAIFSVLRERLTVREDLFHRNMPT